MYALCHNVVSLCVIIISLVLTSHLLSVDEGQEIWSSGAESDCQPDSEEGPESQPLEEDNIKERALGTWLSIIILSLHFR